VGRQVWHAEGRERAEAVNLGIVVHGQRSIGSQMDIQLDPVRPETPGLDEGVDGVFDEAVRVPPMGENRRHKSRLPCVSPIFLLLFGNFTKLLASTASSHYPLLVNPFSVTDTNLGSIM
jgi:hypothetical protein